MLRNLLIAAALPFVAACGAPETWAPEEDVQRALWSAPGPTKLTLFTVESTRNGTGAHSALMVSDSHRALFDPAGSFRHPRAPERNDVIYGMTPNVVAVFIDYHARETFNIRVQEVEVPPEVAARAMQLIEAYGPVPRSQCNIAVTRVLSQLPGFENVPQGWRPLRTAEWMARYPGVNERLITDDDADDNHGVLIQAAKREFPQEER